MRLFLYRTLDTDEDGDPFDHGAVRAMTPESARDLIKDHLGSIGVLEHVETIRVYKLNDRNDAGVLLSANQFKEYKLK